MTKKPDNDECDKDEINNKNARIGDSDKQYAQLWKNNTYEHDEHDEINGYSRIKNAEHNLFEHA